MAVSDEDEMKDVRVRLLGRLVHDPPVPLRPKGVQIASVTDGLGVEGWRLLLVLRRPSGDTWDRDAVFETRRAKTTVTDLLPQPRRRRRTA